MRSSRIAADLLMSIPESGSSLDVIHGFYPSSVEASIFNDGESPSLRVAASNKGEVRLSEEDIQKKIQEWKKHTQENANSAGFRKANRGKDQSDPRKFAYQLSEVARINAQRYKSKSLIRLAKKLRWVASQDRQVAEKALQKLAGSDGGAVRPGMPVIQKPPDRSSPSLEAPEEDTELTPGATIEYNNDQSWSSQESGRSGGRIARDVDSELVTLARDFLQDYKSTNSLYDDEDLLDQLSDPTVFESWLVDLDNKGRNPDPDQLDSAWQQALQEISEGVGEDLPHIEATKSRETIQPFAAPGGDWANSMIRMEENPVMDHYLRTMHDKRSSRGASKNKLDKKVSHAIDQCLDHFAGDMVPSEISEDHVKQFIEDSFPDVSWEKVYDAIQEIADPKRRHEEDPHERTNQEASKRTRGGIASKEEEVRLYVGSPFDRVFEENRSIHSRLIGHREICACCRGTGEGREGCCGHCGGKGAALVDPYGEGVEVKAKAVERLGSLLWVSVGSRSRGVSDRDRRALESVTGGRVAGKGRHQVFRHSPDLMRVLVERGIPYRTVNYRHPRYM